MTPEKVATVLAEHTRDSDGECEGCFAEGRWAAHPCLPYRLAALVSEQAAALARVEALIDTWRPGSIGATVAIQDAAAAVRAALAGEQP